MRRFRGEGGLEKNEVVDEWEEVEIGDEGADEGEDDDGQVNKVGHSSPPLVVAEDESGPLIGPLL